MKNVLDQLKQYWFLIVFIFGGVAAIVKVLGNSYVIEVADSNLKGDAAKQYITELIQHELEQLSTQDVRLRQACMRTKRPPACPWSPSPDYS